MKHPRLKNQDFVIWLPAFDKEQHILKNIGNIYIDNIGNEYYHIPYFFKRMKGDKKDYFLVLNECELPEIIKPV
jgi:hypothetical protein